MENSIIIGEEYCKAELMELAFGTTINGVKNKEFAITDLDGKAIFWVSSDVAIKKKWFILDAASGLPLLSIMKKSWSLHNRWQAFRGERTDEKPSTYLQSERVQISKFIKSGTCFFLPTLRK
ncbi:putative tubby-like protein [Dioscorea sansibarensis]